MLEQYHENVTKINLGNMEKDILVRHSLLYDQKKNRRDKLDSPKLR